MVYKLYTENVRTSLFIDLTAFYKDEKLLENLIFTDKEITLEANLLLQSFNFQGPKYSELKEEELKAHKLDLIPNSFAWPIISDILKILIETNSRNITFNFIPIKVNSHNSEILWLLVFTKALTNIIDKDNSTKIEGTDYYSKLCLFKEKLIDFDVFTLNLNSKGKINTTVLPNVTLELNAGNQVKINQKFDIPKVNGVLASVTVSNQPCSDVKHSEGFSQLSEANYIFDSAGNLISDPNKKVTFHYNYINLPYRIVGSENDELVMLYGADGKLLQRRYLKNNSQVYKIDYISNKEYTNNILESIYHNGGRVIKNGSIFAYEYIIKDHLGNMRVVFADINNDSFISSNEVMQRNDYYAFGMLHKNAQSNLSSSLPKNRFKYNGKEEIDAMGLGMLDYGARYLAKELGRWSVVDPLAEVMPSWSPYSFCFNNPLSFVDPTGAIPYPITIRSFAPFNYFGGGFHGDGAKRGYTTSSTATARVHQRIDFDTDKSKISAKAWSSPTSHRLLPGSNTAKSSVEFTDGFKTKTSGAAKTFMFGTHSKGANPMVPGSPNIDVFSDFSITENKKAGTLDISGTLTGDNFPSTEAFISDPSGQNVFLGIGYYEGSPFSSMDGENKRDISSFNFSISTDKKGNFTGVKMGDKSYSVSDWNKMFEKADPHKNKD